MNFAQAWGSRGHLIICESAIELVKNKTLKTYLRHKTQGLTYLCNVPDIHWKNLAEAEVGYSTHFFEPDAIGLNFMNIPLDFSSFSKMANSKHNLFTGNPVFSAAKELGTSWWRANQFYSLALEAGKRAKQKQEVEKDDEDLFQFWSNLGLLGHFVADNAQPFHTTGNYDGWQNGHGGIHSFYETDLIDELSIKEYSLLLSLQEKIKKDLGLDKKPALLEAMRTLSQISHDDLEVIFSLDPIITPSTLQIEKGMEIKKPATRKSPVIALQKFKPLLIKHLARAAVLLAYAWDLIYVESGNPPIDKDKSYRFPHQYPFIAPDQAENK